MTASLADYVELLPQPTYHKIQSVFKRDPDNDYKTFLTEWAMPEFGYLSELDWVWTEKVDGTNIRFHAYDDGLLLVGGRTRKAEIPPKLQLALEAVSAHSYWDQLSGLTVFGEGYGATIQKGGGDYRPDQGFIVFDVMVTDTGAFLERADVEDIAANLGLPVAPIVGKGPLWDAVYCLQQHEDPAWSRLKEGDKLAEGLVLRPETELRTRLGRRVISKLKVKDFST
jgi:hypothetical protein